MPNTKLIFLGSEKSETSNVELQVYANIDNEIYINIEEHGYPKRFICLDKPTAIKFVREIKKQISYLEEE